MDYNKVYDILVKYCGARETWRQDFVYHHDNKSCDEYRFGGKLGIGGKYWRKKNDVTCYQEDETKERLEIIKKANEALNLYWQEEFEKNVKIAFDFHK